MPPRLAFRQPSNRADYLRLLLLRELWLDEAGPLHQTLTAVRIEVERAALVLAEKQREEDVARSRESLRHEATLSAWLAQRELGIPAPELPPKATLDHFQGHSIPLEEANVSDLTTFPREFLENFSASAIGRSLAKWITDKQLQEPLSDAAVQLGTYMAAAALRDNTARLSAAAEQVAYALGVHQLPRQWLDEAVKYEVRSAMLALPTVNDPQPTDYSLTPLWRSGDIHLPRKPGLLVRIDDDEPVADAVRKLRQLEMRVKARRRQRGPKPIAPPEPDAVALLYRNLKGESFPSLASTLPSELAVHQKTLAGHLRKLKAELFAPGDEAQQGTTAQLLRRTLPP